ncbi:MAG: hypothetical protein J5685_00230 [Clostridiales bacterium]|nr:hypothetical protein [Clostridiales bacterium]
MFYKPKDILPGKTLEELYKIRYKDPLKVPVRIKLKGNRVFITAFVIFSDELLKPYMNRDGYEENGTGTFADHVIKGIKRFWGKEYIIPGIDGPVTVSVDIRTDIPKGQRAVLIRKARFSNTSYVSSPIPRMGWGVFMTLCPESAMINWSLYSPGRINLNLWNTVRMYEGVAAHEFGHTLGIGDAYGAHYRFFYEAPGTEGFLMNDNGSVSPEELLMVLRAHETGKMQYFPYRFVPGIWFPELKKRIKRSLRRRKRRKKNRRFKSV